MLYGAAHPYGQPVTEETVKAITRDDVVAFHKKLFQPGRALVTVVGDVEPADRSKAVIEKALAAWPTGGEKPAFTYPPVPAPQPTTIYLVDKPGAAQSTFAIGNPGPPRNTPDYYALAGDEHDPRRAVPVAAERQHPRGEGLQLRRRTPASRFGKGPGAVPRRRRHRQRQERRRARSSS